MNIDDDGDRGTATSFHMFCQRANACAHQMSTRDFDRAQMWISAISRETDVEFGRGTELFCGDECVSCSELYRRTVKVVSKHGRRETCARRSASVSNVAELERYLVRCNRCAVATTIRSRSADASQATDFPGIKHGRCSSGLNATVVRSATSEGSCTVNASAQSAMHRFVHVGRFAEPVQLADSVHTMPFVLRPSATHDSPKQDAKRNTVNPQTSVTEKGIQVRAEQRTIGIPTGAVADAAGYGFVHRAHGSTDSVRPSSVQKSAPTSTQHLSVEPRSSHANKCVDVGNNSRDALVNPVTIPASDFRADDHRSPEHATIAHRSEPETSSSADEDTCGRVRKSYSV